MTPDAATLALSQITFAALDELLVRIGWFGGVFPGRRELPSPTVASALLRSLEPPRIDHTLSPGDEALGAAFAVCVDTIAGLSLALPVMLDRMFGCMTAARGRVASLAPAGDAP